MNMLLTVLAPAMATSLAFAVARLAPALAERISRPACTCQRPSEPDQTAS
jgi:hypothetical protein